MSKSAVLENFLKINFYCESCDYTTSHKSHYDKHLQSKKHRNLCKKSAVFVKKCRLKSAAKSAVFKCPNCEKIYSTRQGLHYHKTKNKCKYNLVSNDLHEIAPEKKEPEKSNDELSNLMKGMLELCKAQQKTQEKLAENIGKMGNQYNNCNNKNLTVNVYLNEHCKNAMNLTDFVKGLTCSIEDLMYTKDNGYIKGIENIFTKQLEDLNPKERPIHCSDKKRMQFYVKEDDKWKKDEGGEVDKVLTSVSTIQIHELGAWEKLHPNYINDPELLKEWQSIIHAIGGNSTNPKEHKRVVEKFKKTLAEKTSLKKAMKLENKED